MAMSSAESKRIAQIWFELTLEAEERRKAEEQQNTSQSKTSDFAEGIAKQVVSDSTQLRNTGKIE